MLRIDQYRGIRKRPPAVFELTAIQALPNSVLGPEKDAALYWCGRLKTV